MNPLTDYICWLLKSPRSQSEAEKEAQRLGVQHDDAEFYWRTIRR